MKFKVYLDGKEIPVHVDYTGRLITFLRKLGLKAELNYVIQPIEVLGTFEVTEE